MVSVSDSNDMADRDFFLDDCRELERKGVLSAAQRSEWEAALSVDVGRRDELLLRLRALFHQELHELTEKMRVEQNKQHEQSLQQADLVAVAAGGVLGALNAWMRTPAPAPATARKPAPSLWASAFDAAQASLNVVRQRRLLEHLRIQHVRGDESKAERVLLCINGFMTQGADPSRNWAVWAPSDDPSTVLYSVQWEAGDAGAWNEFCAHANENLKGESPAHGLLTHFTGNPWHKAQDKAEQVGILLAQVLATRPAFCRGRKVTLMGHSLGGAVIYSTFQELARLRNAGKLSDTHEPLVHSAVLFAAAFVPSQDGLRCMKQETSSRGQILNVFSQRDDVLGKLFWAIQLTGNANIAAGCAAIDFDGITNIEVSDLVPPRMPNQFGHSYGQHMEQIRARLLPHLR